MWRAWSGLLAVAMLSATASSVEAQLFVTSLSGDYRINIPEEPYGPLLWTLEETDGEVTGSVEVDDIPGVDIRGDLTGEKLFLFFYVLRSEFSVESSIQEVPDLSASNIALVWAFMGNVQGYAISTIGGVPLGVYRVSGQKQ